MEVIARGVVAQAGHVLLCRSLAKGYFYLPGGHVELGETAREALAREFLEETGLSVSVGRGVAAATCRFAQDGRARSEVNLVFHVELSGTADGILPRVASREAEIGFDWRRWEEIPDLDLRPRVIRSWLAAMRDPPHWPTLPIGWLESDELSEKSH